MSRTPTFTSKLRDAREHKGLSRERTAMRLDPAISTKTLERWEREGWAPLWRLEQLAAIYGVPVKRLVTPNGRKAA